MGKEACTRCKELEILIVEQQVQIDDLKKRLLAYENAHTPSSQQRKYPKREPTGNPVGAPQGHEGTTRPYKKPYKTVDVKQEKCSSCHHKLGSPVKIIKRIIEDIPEPQPITVTQYNVHTYICRNCAEVNIPSHPDLPSEGRFGYHLMNEVALMKYEDRLPYEKIVDNLNRRFHLAITAATVLSLIERVTYACEPDYEKISRQIQLSPNIYSDETGQKVQGKNWWTWVFTTPLLALFLIRKSRGQKPLEEALGKDFNGILNCDGWTSYPKIVKKIQRCWAHLLREAKWHAEQYEGQARILYQGLCRMFEQIKHLRKNASLQSRKKTHQKLTRHMRYWVDICKAYKELRKFATKLENGLAYWFTCVLYPEIEPTNNPAERALREIVVQRKITGTLRNEKGTHMLEVMMSVLTTWKLQGLNTSQMLRQTLSS